VFGATSRLIPAVDRSLARALFDSSDTAFQAAARASPLNAGRAFG
jgi:hypothetical protein